MNKETTSIKYNTCKITSKFMLQSNLSRELTDLKRAVKDIFDAIFSLTDGASLRLSVRTASVLLRANIPPLSSLTALQCRSTLSQTSVNRVRAAERLGGTLRSGPN